MKIRAIMLFALSSVLIACTPAKLVTQPISSPSLGDSSSSTQSPSQTFTPSKTNTPPPSPTYTQTPLPPFITPTLILNPSNTITPTVPPGAPPVITTAPGLFTGSWSPDGRYFSFLSQTREDISNMFVGEGKGYSPPGTQIFYDLQTGQICSYTEHNVLQLNFRTGWIGWKGEHSYQVLTYAGDLVTLEAPCDEQPHTVAGVFNEPVLSVLTFSRDDKFALLYGEKTCCLYDVVKEAAVSLEQCSSAAAFSPNDAWLGVTTSINTDLTTYVYTAPSGVLQKVIPWKVYEPPGVGFSGEPQWVSDNQFILDPTTSGSILVSLGKEPQIEMFPVDLFDVSGAVRVSGLGSVDPDNGNLHIIFYLAGEEINQQYLYHTENHTFEKLPYTFVSWYNGNRSLLLCEYDEPSSTYTYWLRAVDPPESVLSQTPALPTSYPVQSPDGLRSVATGQPDASGEFTITILSLPDLAELKSWTDANDTYYFSWSPDSSTLAAVSRPADPSLGGQSVLYIINFK
jgi:hypothetical protein